LIYSRRLDRERHHLNTPLHRLVDRANLRPVIADEDQLELRLEVKLSCRMKRAVIGSPPVMLFTRASSQRLPASVSLAVTSRAPASIASLSSASRSATR
jgi:hypothetical protein